MAIFLSQRWRRQPRSPVGLNAAHFFARALTNFWSFGSQGAKNLIPGKATLGLFSGAAFAPSAEGVVYTGGVGSYATASTGMVDDSPFTMFAYAHTASVPGYSGLVASSGVGALSRNELFLDPSGFIGVTAGDNYSIGATNLADGKWHLFMGGYDGTRFAYVDGVAVSLSGPQGGTGEGLDGIHVGSLALALGTYYWPGQIALAGTLNRAPSTAEASEFGRNFRDIYAPRQRRIYALSAQAGGAKFRRTLSTLGTRIGSRQAQG